MSTLNQRMNSSTLKTISPCATCKHRDKKRPLVCAAFPNGIPDAILLGEHLHRTPFPGDKGVRWEAK